MASSGVLKWTTCGVLWLRPMVINGSHLPEGLLEALGMPKGGGKGFQIKLIRSGEQSRISLMIGRVPCKY